MIDKRKKLISKWLIYTVIISFLIILCLPFLLTRNGWEILNFRETGQIGDTIGGITAPFIGFINVALLCYTLYCQNLSNREQTELTINEQFKSALFSLLTTQREIMQQVHSKFPFINIRDVRIRKYTDEQSGDVFLKSAIEQLHRIFFSLKYDNIGVDDEIAENIENSIEREYYERGINGVNVPQDLEAEFRKYCEGQRLPFIAGYYNQEYGVTEECIRQYKQEESVQVKLVIAARLFFAKHRAVNRYYTHLYCLLKFIKDNEEDAIKRNEQKAWEIREHYRGYARFVQAQMSREEQLLLFYNSFLFPEMQELIIHYGILANLSEKDLIHKTHNCIKTYRLRKE